MTTKYYSSVEVEVTISRQDGGTIQFIIERAASNIVDLEIAYTEADNNAERSKDQMIHLNAFEIRQLKELLNSPLLDSILGSQ